MIKVNIKPLSINQAYTGQRNCTAKYRNYKMHLNTMLPSKLDLPNPPFVIYFEFGLSSKASDGDNCIKATQDCIANKYGFNDKLIKRWVVDAVDVKKGEEYFKFRIESINSFYCHDELVANACEDYDFKKCKEQCIKCKNESK